MKKLLVNLLFLCIPAQIALAQDMQIKLSNEQIDNLDIKIGALTPSHQIPLLYAPAKVVLPASHERLVSSPQPGLVAQLQVNIGDKVQKNQLLATINSPELLNLQRTFLTAANELELATQEYARDTKLVHEGVIADRRWQETYTIHHIKSTQYDAARQMLEIAGMPTGEINTLVQTRKLSSALHIYAPISGVVLERFVTLGTRLDIQAPLYKLADLSELWLEINIPQERLSTVQLGDLVQVENTAITANISLLGQSVNTENQTVLARGVINGKQTPLRVGQNINVQLLQNDQSGDFQVSNTAISQNDGHSYIFVRNAEGFKVTEITIIGKLDNAALIKGPLTGKEQIAVKGAVALKANWLGLGGKE